MLCNSSLLFNNYILRLLSGMIIHNCPKCYKRYVNLLKIVYEWILGLRSDGLKP